MFTTTEDVNERRLRVLQLHIEELNKQASARGKALLLAQAKLKEAEKQRASAAPTERKLFTKVEQQAAELRLAREHRTAAEARAAELSSQLERVVEAARVESETPGQALLLQVTTEQLEATQTALQHANARASEAARLAQQSEAQAAAAAVRQESAEQREAAAQRRLGIILERGAAASLLTLPPPSKGHDLEEQHHILKLVITRWRLEPSWLAARLVC